jgi:hypothetical protein
MSYRAASYTLAQIAADSIHRIHACIVCKQEVRTAPLGYKLCTLKAGLPYAVDVYCKTPYEDRHRARITHTDHLEWCQILDSPDGKYTATLSGKYVHMIQHSNT